jgi:hypothetical protein
LALPGRPAGGAPLGNTNAAGHGAPAGNQNAAKHGLFSQQLSPGGLAIYLAAKEMSAPDLARDTAEFVIAKVAEAYRSDKPWEEASRLVKQVLGQLVNQEKILPEMADALAARLDAPDLATLGKVLAPLKGLLEVKQAKRSAEGAKALEVLAQAIGRSRENNAKRQDGAKEG